MRRFLAVTALLALAAAAPAWEHYLVPGQKAFGTITVADEEDEIVFRAEAGAKVSFTLKQRKGQPLLPAFTKVVDPSAADLLGSTIVAKTNGKGTVTTLKFLVPTGGNWTLGISGASGTTGTWDLVSKGPARVPLGTATIAAPGGESAHPFDLDAGTTATVQAKAVAGSLLRPLFARVEMPGGAGNADLAAVARKTAAKSDTLTNLPVNANGTWTFVVTGADGTTGSCTVTLKPGKKVPLDFTVDPTEGPPPAPPPTVTTVAPSSAVLPSSGTESRGFTVTGASFVSGAAVSISAGAGTNGISGVATTFNSSTSLSVTFDLAATATPGARDVTVTNPDLQAGTKVGALTLLPAPAFSVSAVTPDRGSGSGGTAVVVQGALFPAASSVTFGGVPARSLNVVDSANIVCVVPPAAALSGSAGTAVDVVVDDGSGNQVTLAGGFTYEADPSPPTVASTVPADQATGVPRSIRTYVFVLTEPVDPATASSTAGFDWFGSPVQDVASARVASVAAGPGGRMVVMKRNPSPGSLAGANGYRANLPATVTDLAGNPLDPAPFGGSVYQGAFTTHASNADAAPPTVASTSPANASSNAPVDGAITVSFSEAVDPTTLAPAITFLQGAAPIPFDLDLDATCTTATILPRRKLAAATTFTLTVGTALRDLSGNALASASATGFTTAAADTVAPVQVLTVDGLPADLNGSGTYVTGTSNGGAPSAPGGPLAFNVLLPRSGFTVDVSFSDLGGSGVDPSSFSCTCSAAMGSVPAATDLSGNFSVTALGATWTVDASHALAAGTGISFTVNVADYAGNPATARTLVVDVADITRTINDNAGTPSTDRDPFNARQTWLLRFDQDVWTVTATAGTPNYESPAHGNPITVLTTASPDGVNDFEADLRLLGLNGAESAAGASTVVNGSDTGANAIVRTMVKKAVRGFINMRYGIGYDGTRTAGSVDIEFLLAGETKSGGGTVNPAGWTGSSGFSMMSFAGDERAIGAGVFSLFGTIGRANFDLRNRNQDDDSNDGVGGSDNVGVFGTHMIRVRLNDPESTLFPSTFDPLISLAGRGGTPVGADANDAFVLAAGFNYGAANAARKARFDLIQRCVDRYALYLSQVGAHEIGHSTGLVADGPPRNGLFGNAHPNNSFVATSSFTTSAHLDAVGPNIMEAAASFDDAVAQGSSFSAFEPLSLSYLLRRMIYDQ